MTKKNRGRYEGSISQRSNGSWRAQLSTQGSRVSKGFKTKSEALTWIRNMQSEVDRGLNYAGGKITLDEYLYKWLQTARIALRPKTSSQYEHLIGKHILPRIGKVSLKDLRLIDIEKFYGEMALEGIGIRTIRITHNILHQALGKAVKYNLILANPAHGAALPRYKSGEMKVLDEAQITQLLVAAQDSPYLALYQLAITTGMRQGEILGLKWTDLQWQSGILHVQRQAQDIRGQGTIFQEPKTRAGRRTIKLGESTLQALRVHRQRKQVQKLVAGQRWKDHDLIFPSSAGTPLDPSNLRLDFYQVLEKAGLPKVRFHDLRHTAASLMLNHGIPVIVVSKMLGHSKPSITLDIYGHLYNEMQDEAAKMMDELLTPIPTNLSNVVPETAKLRE